ncbi:MAG TPA: DNA cytosine methyltransferase [Kaistia sp.]|nr:DNA cytosine methyltransferase [Kaistia sp.]
MNVALHSRHSLDVISLCSGGGGLDLALDLAIPGARAAVMVEREAFAVAHLVAAMEAGLMAPAPVWSDVRTFDGRPWRGLVDGLIGGIPCQPHSLAGRKRGSLDARDLWSSARRIIAHARPWFVLIENVSGMLAAGADDIAGAERVWRDLRRLGFAVEIGLFRASEVDAPQEGERIFILGLAEAGSEGSQGSEWRGSPRCRNGATASRSAAELCAAPLVPESLFPPRPFDFEGWRAVLDRAPELEPAVRVLADGLGATRIDWLRLLGNGVVPLQGAYAIRTLLARHAARGSARAAELVPMMEAAE